MKKIKIWARYLFDEYIEFTLNILQIASIFAIYIYVNTIILYLVVFFQDLACLLLIVNFVLTIIILMLVVMIRDFHVCFYKIARGINGRVIRVKPGLLIWTSFFPIVFLVHVIVSSVKQFKEASEIVSKQYEIQIAKEESVLKEQGQLSTASIEERD